MSQINTAPDMRSPLSAYSSADGFIAAPVDRNVEKAWLQEADNADLPALRNLASEPDATAAVLHRLVQRAVEIDHPGRFLLQASVARHKNTSPETILLLAQQFRFVFWGDAKLVVAQSAAAPAEALRLAAFFGSPAVRKTVAGHPNTDPRLLAKLSSGQEELETRRAAVANKAFLAQRLDRLARSSSAIESDGLLPLIAAHPNLSAETMEYLLEHRFCRDVVSGVAGNPGAPSCLLDRLHDECEPDDIAVKLLLAEHQHASADLLLRLSSDIFDQVRFAVAAHDNCPSDALTLLMMDSNSEIRERASWRMSQRSQ